MFGTIRKHQTWLWAIIITLTIISFVIFFSPYSRLDGGRGKGNLGVINGEKITREAFSQAYEEVLLQYFFMSDGNWLTDANRNANFDPEQRTYLRLLAIQKQEDLGIHVSSEVAGQFATRMIQRYAENPQAFVQKVLAPRGLDLADLERFMRHELGIQEMISTVGLSGKLVTPDEVKGLYVRENEEISSQAIFFSGSNYLNEVSAPAEAVMQHYSNQLAVYRIPERLQVGYVKFPLSNHLATAEKLLTNLNEIVDVNFQRFGSNYLKDAKSPEEAKAKMRQEILERQALLEARKEAIPFASKLFDIESPRPEYLEALAKSNGLPFQISAPFDRDDPPKDLDVTPDFAKVAFGLTAEEPFAQPILGRDGVYVIGFNKKLPSEVPSFESIRDKVTHDYKYGQALTLARKAGAEFDKVATNALAQGKTFEAISGEAKVKPVTLPPFSLTTRELEAVEGKLSLNQLKQIAFGTQPGKLSSFQPTLEGGVTLYVKSKAPPSEMKLKAEMPAYVNTVRQNRQREAFEAWFRKEAEKSLRDIPYFRQKEQQQMSGSRTAKS